MVGYLFLTQNLPWSALIRSWSIIVFRTQSGPGQVLDPGRLFFQGNYQHIIITCDGFTPGFGEKAWLIIRVFKQEIPLVVYYTLVDYCF